MDGLVTKTRSIPWRGVLALIGGFLIQVRGFVHFDQICFAIFFILALPWLLLLVWQHDDLSYILHEVSFVINRKNHSVMHFKWLTPVLKAPRVSRLDLWWLHHCPVCLGDDTRRHNASVWTGARPAMFTGCAIFSLGTALTYFTLEMVISGEKRFWPIVNFQGLPWVAYVALL